VELAVDARLLEVRTKELGRRGLVAGRIRGVETDQLLQEPDRLVAQRRLPSDMR
jgi:hypothetical protein